MKKVLAALTLFALPTLVQAMPHDFIRYYPPGVGVGGSFESPGQGIIVDTVGDGTLVERCLSAGDGIFISNSCGVAGDIAVSIDSTVTPKFVTGTDDHPAECGDTGDDIQIGSTYIETDEMRVDTCVGVDDWVSVVGSNTGDNAGYATVDDEDTPLTVRTALNFEGAGVTCADDTNQTTCTIPGGAGVTVSSNTASATPLTSTAAFDVTYDIVANTLAVGDVISVRAAGFAIAGSSSQNYSMVIRFDTTAASDTIASGNLTASTNFGYYMELECVVRTIGAGGTMMCGGFTALRASTTALNDFPLLSTATVAIDTTQNLTIDVFFTDTTGDITGNLNNLVVKIF